MCKIAKQAELDFAVAVEEHGEEAAQAATERRACGHCPAPGCPGGEDCPRDHGEDESLAMAGEAWAEAARHFHDEGCSACAAAAQI